MKNIFSRKPKPAPPIPLVPQPQPQVGVTYDYRLEKFNKQEAPSVFQRLGRDGYLFLALANAIDSAIFVKAIPAQNQN
jgi:hypothetical protein